MKRLPGRWSTTALAFAASLVVLLAASAAATPFHPRISIDPASPSIDGNITPDDVLSQGPAVFIQGRNLGLQDAFFTGVYDNLADFSFGQDPIRNPLFFSVDRVALGLPGSDVFAQALPGVESAAADIYRALPPDSDNALVVNEGALGLVPGFFGDDIDGLELDTDPAPNTYFAIDRLSATNGFGSNTLASDILVSPGNGAFGIYATFPQIGLDPRDAIDGLVLLDAALDAVANPGIDQALFSVDPFSPDTFTFTGLPYVPCVPGHMSPADVCYTDFTGTFSLWATAGDLGLRSDDNVDALDTGPPAVAEPGTAALLALAVCLFGLRRARGKGLIAALACVLSCGSAWAIDPPDPGKGFDYVFYGWSAPFGNGAPGNRAMLLLDIDDPASPRPYPDGPKFKLEADNAVTSGVLEVRAVNPLTHTLIGVQDSNPARYLLTYTGTASNGGSVIIAIDAALEANNLHYLRAVVDVVHNGIRTRYQVDCPPFVCDVALRPYD